LPNYSFWANNLVWHIPLDAKGLPRGGLKWNDAKTGRAAPVQVTLSKNNSYHSETSQESD
jgi:hypothetical protein